MQTTSSTTAFDVYASRYTGKERDAESGLDYFGARYYANTVGRFTNPDDGSDQNPKNPQSLNLYAYVRNNPINTVDSDGRSVQVCTPGNGTIICTTLTNDAYTDAAKGFNGSLNVPSLNQVGMNGDGSGQFNSTAITDANGNSVGSATYVSNGGADYYANRNGIDNLAMTGATVGRVKGVAAFYGASLVGAAGVYAAGLTAGAELTTLGDIEAVQPSPATVAQVERQLAKDGVKSLEKSLRSAQKVIAEHEGKIGAARTAGGYTSSMESEVQQARALIRAITQVLGR